MKAIRSFITDIYSIKVFLYSFAIAMPSIEFIEKFIFKDWDFVGFLMVLLFADTVTGIYSSIKEGRAKNISYSKILDHTKLWKSVEKIGVYSIFLVASHAASSFFVSNPNSETWLGFVATKIDVTIYAFITVREFLSINKNLEKIGYSLIPFHLLKKLKDFINSKSTKNE